MSKTYLRSAKLSINELLKLEISAYQAEEMKKK